MPMPQCEWSGTPLGPQKDWPLSLAAIYRLMMHSRQPMFIAWGPELTFLYNEPYAVILGPRHPHAFARRFDQVWADIWPDIKPLVGRALAGESTWRENMHLLMTRHGYPEDTWYTFSYSPLHDDAGRIAGMFCTCIETTRQVLAERALRENEGRFRALLDAAPAMMWVTDRHGNCTHLNRSWYAFTGQTPVTGLGHGWLEAVHPEDRPVAARLFEEAVRNKATLRLDYRLRHVDGAWRYATDAAQPRLDENGVYLGHVGSVLDITERRQAEERQTLLAREVDHRAKNVLAVVQAMVRLTRAADVDGYAQALQGRVAALARAHTLLAADSWAAADLGTLLAGELTAFLGVEREARVTIEGPAVALPPAAAQPLTMIVHELATNAIKHGALSVEAGRLDVRWSTLAGWLRLAWTERGGPLVPGAPRRLGFGTRVLDGTVRGQLGGRLHMDWRAEGLACVLDLPLTSQAEERAEQPGLVWGAD
ncbi:PAS domain S-box protein [Roseomonas frigidaquae]|uniref:histidine kinase n=1 Tax=Falsiroseomonas frigidaquae TaxID=487318 RepID=A0ABX1F5F6_9PROT|nr:PAS domain S-box protein [Falsiroseomonas frigidaquae]NKE47598.1 PAS domain S-box protein [Falsiroseomonas frigidaquae]